MSVTYRAGRWQIKVPHKLLPRPFYATFDDETQARAYDQQLRALLDRGVVPQDLADATTGPARGADPRLAALIDAYRPQAAPTDLPVLALIEAEHGDVRLSAVSTAWADQWVAALHARGLVPGTIRKRIGALARVIDARLRLTHGRSGGTVPANPLRLMSRGYSQSGAADAPRDKTNNRRVTAAEIDQVRAVLMGIAPKPADRQRPYPADPALLMLFDLIVATGLRLREAYTLQVAHVDLARQVLHVRGSKGHRGAAKLRTVPLLPWVRPELAAWCQGRVGLLLPFWDGSTADLRPCTNRLSARFGVLFDYADVPTATEHDLRHTATCNWFEMRRPGGGWMFSEIEICKIMGWSDTKMALRYASFRAEDLSARLG